MVSLWFRKLTLLHDGSHVFASRVSLIKLYLRTFGIYKRLVARNVSCSSMSGHCSLRKGVVQYRMDWQDGPLLQSNCGDEDSED